MTKLTDIFDSKDLKLIEVLIKEYENGSRKVNDSKSFANDCQHLRLLLHDTPLSFGNRDIGVLYDMIELYQNEYYKDSFNKRKEDFPKNSLGRHEVEKLQELQKLKGKLLERYDLGFIKSKSYLK